MKQLFKDKRIVAVGAVVLIVLVLVGLVFISGRSANKTDQNTNATPTEIPIPTISAESIGLTLALGRAGQTVIVTVDNPEGITAIEYELSYLAEGDLPRGAIGELDVTKKPVRKEITLGTCSDVCHYDKNVTDIKIILKVTKEDGKVYQAEQALESIGE